MSRLSTSFAADSTRPLTSWGNRSFARAATSATIARYCWRSVEVVILAHLQHLAAARNLRIRAVHRIHDLLAIRQANFTQHRQEGAMLRLDGGQGAGVVGHEQNLAIDLGQRTGLVVQVRIEGFVD